MRELPDFVPTLIASGEYQGEISGEVEERQSTFEGGGTYYRIPMILQAPDEDYLTFNWSTSPKNSVFGELLIAIGGKKLPSGVISRPKSYLRRPFIISISQRKAKGGQADTSRLVNEVLWIRPFVPTAAPPTEGKPPTDDDFEGPLEDAPF